MSLKNTSKKDHGEGMVSRKQEQNEIDVLTASPLFDEEFYLNKYPDVAEAGYSAAEHYLKYGEKEGRQPSEAFDPEYYLKENPDAAESGMNLLVHYILYGEQEGRKTKAPEEVIEEADVPSTEVDEKDEVAPEILLLQASPLFDEEFYLNKYPDVAKAGMSAAEHYLEYGEKEGRQPSETFDPVYYLKENPDVADSGMNLLVHYILYGEQEGRKTKAPEEVIEEADVAPAEANEKAEVAPEILLLQSSPLFDEKFYLSEYPDVAEAGVSAVEHYLKYGEKEGRLPSESFDPEYYLKENPDVAAAGVSPLVHYLWAGRAEGRKAMPDNIRLDELLTCPVTLIIDHNGGGGTWKYLYDNILSPSKNGEETTESDKVFLLARYDLGKKRVAVQVCQNWEILKMPLSKREQDFFEEIESMNFEEIIVNSVVNWPVAKILNFVTKYKRKNHLTRVQYKGHDFFCVCPSYTLMDSSNLYCGVRCDEVECCECLKGCEEGRVALTPAEKKDFSISRWRLMWSNFFYHTVDRFEVFSESSKSVFLKAYPRLDQMIKLIPHKIPSFDCCRVAVIGTLAVHKGLNIVKELCDFLDTFCIDDMMIHSFGECGNISSKHLVTHGAYARQDLPELLKKEKIDLVFIPSVCHETFCYTMGESLALGYPTACFDIGGQADQAKNNDLGIILYDKKPSYIYRTLMDVYRAGAQQTDSDTEEPTVSANPPAQRGAATKVIVQDRTSRDFLTWMYQQRADKSHFVPKAEDSIKRTDKMPQVIAAYLPQFHDFPENIRWFGRGFTEWTNTSQTLPQFIGHRQPQVPIDVGYYNLNNTDAMHRQAELAKKYGVTGFCVYYYWFSGTKLMDAPLKRILEDKTLDFPFFLFWANDDWTRSWGDGAMREVLYHSEMKPEEAGMFMADVLPYMKDPRYIKINNKPVLLLYKVHLFPIEDYLQFVENIQAIAKKNGFDGLYLISPIEDYMDHEDLEGVQEKYHLDALMEFHPIAGRKGWQQKKETYVDPDCRSTCYDVDDFIQHRRYILDTKAKVFPGLFPNWDNSPRRYNRGAWILQNTPENYKKWLADLIQWTNNNLPANERFIFVNAWNEWAECAHLEPDTYYGYAYLQKTREALEESTKTKEAK